jgi:type IV secretion system protein VirD4
VNVGLFIGASGLLAVIALATGPGSRHSDRGARWASRGELAPLRLRWRSRRHGDGGRSRLALGRHHGATVYAEARHALVVFGPPQSGKSAGLAIPSLLEWEGPAIASSIKTDLLGATAKRRRELGEVLIFDPFQLLGDRSHGWSPLHNSGTWDGALETAWRLAAAGELDQRGTEGGDFWAVAAEQRLAPLLYTAAHTGGGIPRVVSWAYGQGARELERSVAALATDASDPQVRGDARQAYEAVRAFEAQADRTRSSIEATAQALLRAYRFNRVAASAERSEITAERLLSGANTLYLIGDPKASKLLRPIFIALLSEVIDAAYASANAAGGRLERPLLLCLDEAGNVAPIPNLAEVASTAPSHNIQLVSIFHDLAQARARYGQQAETVINSHRARMLLPGVGDMDTLRYFSTLVGDADVRDVTRSNGRGGASTTSGRRRLPLLAPESLRQLPDNHALLLYGRLAPARVRLRLYFKDRRLRRLTGG